MKLASFELRWAHLAFGVIFPGNESIGGIDRMDTSGFLTEVCHTVPFKAALGLRLAIWLVALAPLFVLHRFATITGLTPADREQMIVKLLASPRYGVRQLVMILKTMGALLYGANADVRAKMLGPVSTKSGPQKLARIRLKSEQAA